ncbi:MAG: AAA domain-containing protein [Gammaproteobacteria bacterium]|nr:AAA domain-containing protein [Gammaproteobacteria bacterium]
MSLWSIPSVITIAFLLIPFSFAVKNWNRSTDIKLLCAFLVQIFIYLIGESFLINSSTAAQALFWDKFLYAGVIFMPATYLHILLLYQRPMGITKKPYLGLILYALPVFQFSLLWTDLFIAGVQPTFWGYGKEEGPAYQFFRIYLVVHFIICLGVLYAQRRRARLDREKTAIAYLWVGSGVPFGVVTVVLILQQIGIKSLDVACMPLSILIFSCILTYAMVKHHLFDLHILFGPLMNNRRYTLYQKLKRAIRQVRRLTRFKDVIALLHKTLECDVALNIKGHFVVAIGGGPGFRDFRLQENLLKKIEIHKNNIPSLGRQLVLLRGRLPKGLEEIEQGMQANSIEAIIPLYAYGRLLGILKFGPGFAEKAFSSQIAGMIDMFCNEFIASFSVIEAVEAELAEKDRIIEEQRGLLTATQTPWKEVAFRFGQTKDYTKAILYQDEISTFISDSSVVKEAVKKAGKAAKSEAPVLLLGDTGTGKEVFARMIQRYSGKKMIVVNCAAIAKDLIMSEIFGHEKGAFTDAKTARQGRIEAAAGGILFLDEIGEMPEMAQAALLRVVEGGAYSRLGSNTMHTANVQFVAATNKGVTDQPGQAGIRRDLHSRFPVRIQLPALWERKKDIPLLAEYFLARANNGTEKKECRISEAAMRELCDHPLQGNVRDLQRLIHNVVDIAPADAIIASIYQSAFNNSSRPGRKIWAEKRIELLEVLKRHGNNQAKAAAALGIAPSVLSREIKAAGLSYIQLLENLQRTVH